MRSYVTWPGSPGEVATACGRVRFVNKALRRGCVASMLICVESNMVCERWLAKKMQRVNAGMCKNCSHCVEAVFARNLIVGALLLLPENGLHAMGDDSGAGEGGGVAKMNYSSCLLYTSPSPRDA